MEFKDWEHLNALNSSRVLIESDWNLKYVWTTLQVHYIHSINRIRLEFKVNKTVVNLFWTFLVLIESDWNLKQIEVLVKMGLTGINRIRLEFKVSSTGSLRSGRRVLIESDWNLKVNALTVSPITLDVLIESDWNLKLYHIFSKL